MVGVMRRESVPWEGLNVSPGCSRVLDLLVDMPLVSVPELVKAEGRLRVGDGKEIVGAEAEGAGGVGSIGVD